MAMQSVDLRDYTRFGDSAERGILLFGDDISACRGHNPPNDTDERLYKDLGIDYFDATTTNFQFTLKSYYDGVGVCVPWALANTIDRNPSLWYANGDLSIALIASGRNNAGAVAPLNSGAAILPQNTLYMVCVDGASSAIVDTATIDTETMEYFVSITRANGASDMTFTCSLYTDSARTNLYDAISVVCSTQFNFRYHVAASSWNSGNTDEGRWLIWDQTRNV